MIPTGNAPLLTVRNLQKDFVIDVTSVTALQNVNLTINAGEFICLIGASGCGKSTLLRVVAGFETASSGEVSINGHRITGPGSDRGMVFQDFALFPWLSVRDNIAFGPIERGLPKAEIEAKVEQSVELVGLRQFANAYPHQLSGGMKQRVAIARVLANDASLLLMDEPFGALDAMTRERLQEELLDIWQRTKLTVIFVTHSIEEAVYLSDRVIVMTPGPGRIKNDITITLPRPRNIVSSDFNDARALLAANLHSHLAPKADAA